MNISKIENNKRIAQDRLPTKRGSHYITTLSELRRITGEDWRETAAITPVYDQTTHRLTDDVDLATGLLLTEAISAEEIEAARIAAVPTIITMRQARIALSRAGLLDEVEVLVTAIGGEAQIVWEYSSEVQRLNPLVGIVAAQAGWTTIQVDDLFTTAATL
jgi:hypothetical protein